MKKTTAEKLANPTLMDMYESIQINDYLQIIRIPGGYICKTTDIWDYQGDREKVSINTVFVATV